MAGGDAEGAAAGGAVGPESRQRLPAWQRAGDIVAALAAVPRLVCQGETGSGKSTAIPQILYRMGYRHIAVTQPRRVAVRRLAARVAEEMGASLGDEVGYQHRFAVCRHPGTAVSYVTDGLLLRELGIDADLSGYDAVMLDEAHERNVNTDLLLALLKPLLARRPDLCAVVASATLETERIAAYLGFPVMRLHGRTHPVEASFREVDVAPADLAREAARATVGALRRGSVLVFLPGKREIEATMAALADRVPDDVEVLPLHADLPIEEQDRATHPASRRRVLCATNVAESSLTVDGVASVVDSGWVRLAGEDPATGIRRLDLVPASQASLVQRRGRAGRTAPGWYDALFTRRSWEERLAFTPPELLRQSLEGALLELLYLGYDEGLDLLDAPPRTAWAAARATLDALGAVDAGGALTPLGRRMAELPLGPRLARLVLEAARRGCLHEAALLALLLEQPAYRLFPSGEGYADLGSFYADCRSGSEVERLQRCWRQYLERREDPGWLRSHGFHPERLMEVGEAVGQVEEIAARLVLSRPPDPAAGAPAGLPRGPGRDGTDRDGLREGLREGLRDGRGGGPAPALDPVPAAGGAGVGTGAEEGEPGELLAALAVANADRLYLADFDADGGPAAGGGPRGRHGPRDRPWAPRRYRAAGGEASARMGHEADCEDGARVVIAHDVYRTPTGRTVITRATPLSAEVLCAALPSEPVGVDLLRWDGAGRRVVRREGRRVLGFIVWIEREVARGAPGYADDLAAALADFVYRRERRRLPAWVRREHLAQILREQGTEVPPTPGEMRLLLGELLRRGEPGAGPLPGRRRRRSGGSRRAPGRRGRP